MSGIDWRDEGEDSNAGRWVSFNNAIKQRRTKTKKDLGRTDRPRAVYIQHTHNGSAQGYRHQEAKYGDKQG